MLLVDGKSDDKTITIFDKFKSKLPAARLIISDKRNVSHQRNLGGKNSTGEYLVFLDADVDVAETFLEELHVAAIKHKFKLATTWIMPDSDKPIDKLMLTIGNLSQEIAKVINKPYTGGYNTIVKRDFFLKISGFREDVLVSEDQDFALRANKAGVSPVILKEPYVVWSLRRFRAEGKLRVLRKCAQAGIHNLLRGPITKELFDYPMGGHVHVKKKKKKVDLTKLNTYIHAIRKLENQMVRLFEE
jgi:glycosyltransferase involved in cell wall biosynthesis